MWVVFFCNITAGIALISFQSPLLQDLWKKTDANLSKEALAACGATLIAVSSLFNGIGRLFWGGLSDRIGRVQSFRLMLATQVVAFFKDKFPAEKFPGAAAMTFLLASVRSALGGVCRRPVFPVAFPQPVFLKIAVDGKDQRADSRGRFNGLRAAAAGPPREEA